ncbi:MAG: hypothetical protein JNL42_14050 [Anaerolineae bacterium]|nr:hypothetical protein [Anaerolineae bacterium]
MALAASVSSPDTVTVYPFVEAPGGLRDGDAVIRVDGRDVQALAGAIFDGSVPAAVWTMGDTLIYTVARDGRQTDVQVTLGRFALGVLISQHLPTLFLLLFMQAQAVWMWRVRQAEVATRVLLLATSAFVAFSICWTVGAELPIIATARGLFLAYRVVIFIQLMLMCSALLHFAIILPGSGAGKGYTRAFFALIYLIPYPVHLIFFFFAYSLDALAWLRRWEFSAIGLILLAFVFMIIALVVGYRRMGGSWVRSRRVRSRVLIVAIAFITTALFASLLGAVPALLSGQLALQWDVIPLLSIPVAVGLSVSLLFYQLFDIRVVIQRSLVWGALSLMIVVVYVVVVGTLSAAFQDQTSPLFALIATGIVAIFFASVRARLQRVVNWLLYGERDNPYQVIAHLSRRLEQSLAPGEALAQIVKTVSSALKLPYAAIELLQDQRYVRMASWGDEPEERIDYPLINGGQPIGRLVVAPRAPGEALTPGDHQLLTDLLFHAESVIRAVQLTADLQHSREKLVMAREEERRRVSHDLHDGLGPSLASLMMLTDAARNLLKVDPEQVDPLLVDLKAQAGEALADIRRLVYELHPPALAQRGLRAAITDKAHELERGSDMRISVDIPAELPQMPAAAEVALYRICLEAMTNVVRHAGAACCAVRLICDDVLRLEICDDGVGLPENHRTGVGLVSMVERAVELGGSCVIERRNKGGTRVIAHLPYVRLKHQEGVM